MSSYRDPAPRGDVYPSEEEIDPTGSGVFPASAPTGAYPAGQPTPQPSPAPGPAPAPVPTPGPPPRIEGGARSIVSRHLDGSVAVVTDFDGDGVADVVQYDLDGDGIPDVTYLDNDRDGRLETVLRTPTR
ncbi:thrombospondin type 3 repeat-containing protein [Micromonospora sp. NPDC049903]|uniref:thrombospondin type 3 repeat-containing protein n=1 Tax=Micromonospora sp. NPDC049903 TaxID=3364276 RepID=UPI00379E73F0